MLVQKVRTYTNPVWQGAMGDPFVLKVRGRYYAYATENARQPLNGAGAFPILTSTDLVHWQEIGRAMPSLGAQYFCYWAPEVTEYNGQFLLYYAVHRGDEFLGSIRVAVADNPEGPFIDSGRDLTSHLVPWAIDPHVFRDQDGQWYLYVTIEYLNEASGFVGSGNAVVRLADPFTPEGELTKVTPPSQTWQLFEANRKEKGGIDWYTVEGPTVLQHRRKYYEMFSGGCYYRDNYAVSYATANKPMGVDGMQDVNWQDSNNFVLRGTPDLIGPGHNSMTYGPNNVEQYIVYHAWQADMKHRRQCIDRLFWHGQKMWSVAPTSTPQTVPALPRLRELFDTAVLSSSWSQHRGSWSVLIGEVGQDDVSASHATLQHEDGLLTSGLLEVNLRHVEGEGRYGVELQSEQGEAIRVTLDEKGLLTVSAVQVAEEIATFQLSEKFHMQAWHQLKLVYTGTLLTLYFDWLEIATLPLAITPHTFALYTDHCQAAFSGVSLTDHFQDEFLDDRYTPAQLGWQSDSADWRIEQEALVQTSNEQGEHIAIKGSFLQDVEVNATMRLRQSDSSSAAMGLLLQTELDGVVHIVLRKQATAWTLSVKGAGIKEEVPVADGFDGTAWHTMRVVQRAEQLAVYLDGPQVFTIAKDLGMVKLGLVTNSAAVEFISVAQTGLH